MGSNLGSPSCSFLGLQIQGGGSGKSLGEWLLLEKSPSSSEVRNALPECVNPHLWIDVLDSTLNVLLNLLLGNLDRLCKGREREKKGGKLPSG